jgi:predicted pyridoxine 5'-phosphate oxidase superfamily flavin-nucleotide-binding protein
MFTFADHAIMTCALPPFSFERSRRTFVEPCRVPTRANPLRGRRAEGEPVSSFGKIGFTPSVKAIQERMGSRDAYARLEQAGDVPDVLGEEEVAFLAERDSFYMATVSETGWPYIQHRGGPPGFVRVLDERTIGFADFRGNRQYISVGNVSRDDRVALIFVDYPNRARLKVLARASSITGTDDSETMRRLVRGVNAKVERAFVLRVEGFDWNCPQHITPRFTEEEVRRIVNTVVEKVDALEAENRDLRARLSAPSRER